MKPHYRNSALICSLFLILISCDCPTSPVPVITSAIRLDILYLHAPGGQCVQGAAAMTASYVKGIVPTVAMLAEQNTWLHDQEKGISMTQVMPLFWEYWHLNGSRYRKYSFPDLYAALQQGTAMVVFLAGWRGMWHTVVLTGIDAEFVYVHDPTLGPLTYRHEDFDRLRARADYGVVVVRE